MIGNLHFFPIIHVIKAQGGGSKPICLLSHKYASCQKSKTIDFRFDHRKKDDFRAIVLKMKSMNVYNRSMVSLDVAGMVVDPQRRNPPTKIRRQKMTLKNLPKRLLKPHNKLTKTILMKVLNLK